MICYEKNNSLVFATVKPTTVSENYNKIITLDESAEEFYQLQNTTEYEELNGIMKPTKLHQVFHESLNMSGCFTYNGKKYDFNSNIAYSDSYDNKTRKGSIKQFKILQPIVTGFCTKGSFNSFATGRQNPINEDCNLFAMLNYDKEALKELHEILLNSEPEYAQMMITELWPEFACLYYQINPEITLEETCVFNIKALNRVKKIDPQAEPMLNMEQIARDNTKILKLLPKK